MHATTESDSAEPFATTVAIDLAKDVLEVAFADASGRIVGDLWRGARQCRSPDGAAQRHESGVAVGGAQRLVMGGEARSSPGLRFASSGLRCATSGGAGRAQGSQQGCRGAGQQDGQKTPGG